MEASNPVVSAKNGELVLCNINMDSSGGDFLFRPPGPLGVGAKLRNLSWFRKNVFQKGGLMDLIYPKMPISTVVKKTFF